MLLPDEDVRRHSLRKDDVALTPSKHVDKIITFPVEPKVNGMHTVMVLFALCLL